MTEQLFAQTLDDAIGEAHQILADAEAHFGPFVAKFALFSGGDDSTVMLHLAGQALRTVTAVHINTGWGIEETREFVRETAPRFYVPLKEYFTDPEVYRQDVLANGFPTFVTHNVMYHKLKRERIRDLTRETKTHRHDRLMLISGERSSESDRRMRHARKDDSTMRREGALVWVNPIWFFDQRLMNEYRTRFSLPRNPVSVLLHRSGECLCTATMRPLEWEEVVFWKPEDPCVKAILELQAELERRDEVPKRMRRPCWAKLPENKLKPAGPLCVGCSRLFEDESHTQGVRAE